MSAHPSCPDPSLLGPLAIDSISDVDGGAAAHVAGCATCQARVARLRALFSTPLPPATPPPVVLEEVLARIGERSARESETAVGASGLPRPADQGSRRRDEDLGRLAPGAPERRELVGAARSVDAHPLVGRRIGRYRIVSILGEGGMGVVYRAEHVTDGTTAAVKSLHSSLMHNEHAKERFVREAQALARLQHPNIISLLEFFQDEHGCFILMEFADGEDLEAKIQKTGLLPPSRCLPWFVDVCRGLGYAHERGIIHRDIKPSNIVVQPSGRAKVLDFGTAKLVDAKRLTQQGMTLGTIIYMSKEQLLGKAIDARSDIYSLGVTLYECVTGQLPFYDEEERKLVVKIAKEEPIPPSKHYPAISPELERVILKAMAKDPDQRYQTAAQLESALSALCTQEAVLAAAGVTPARGPAAPSAGAAPAVGPPAAPAVGPLHLQPLVVVGLCLLVLGLGIGLPATTLTTGAGRGIGAVLLGLALAGALLVAGGYMRSTARAACRTCGRALLRGMTVCPFCHPPAA